MKKIVFVCTGNTCRSPMAQGLFQKMLAERGAAGIEVLSAGIAAVDGQPATPQAVEVMAEVGIDIGGHRSRAFGRDLSDADRIVTMTEAQRRALEQYGDRVTVLPMQIPDPFGGSLAQYRDCRDAIAAALEELTKRPGFLP